MRYTIGMRVMPRDSSIDQNGFASLVIALIMVIVLGLTTVGFAELMRKEERNALDKQLSSQAYYAAESGINDAARALNAGFNEKKTKCDPMTPADIASLGDAAAKAAATAYLADNRLRDSSDLAYTCLTINPAPETYEWNQVNTDQSKVVTMTGVNPDDGVTITPIGTLEVSWQDASNNSPAVPGSSTDFEKGADWPYIGVLRVGLTPLASGGIRRESLINDTYTSYLYPNASSAPIASDSAASTGTASGNIVRGNCNDARQPLRCSVRITNLTQANYLMTLRSVYKGSRVSVRAFAFDGSQLALRNGQTVVDATGKAQDVLRRVQVRIPSKSTYDHPDAGIQSMSGICKQLNLIPEAVGSSQTTAECPYP